MISTAIRTATAAATTNSAAVFSSSATAAAKTSASTSSSSQRPIVLSTYRTLLRYARRLPSHQGNRSKLMDEVQSSYRSNIGASPDDVPSLLHEAGKRIAFLRITTPKSRWDEVGLGLGEGTGSGETRWVYKSGERGEEGAVGTAIKGRNVVSNWDGRNLDPCSVKRHNASLKRAGFVNNLHAKGLF